MKFEKLTNESFPRSHISICRNQFESASSCSLHLVLQKQRGLQTSGNEVLSNGFVYRSIQEDQTLQNFG